MQVLPDRVGSSLTTVQRGLDHGAIDLTWNVDPYLPETPLTPVLQPRTGELPNAKDRKLD